MGNDRVKNKTETKNWNEKSIGKWVDAIYTLLAMGWRESQGSNHHPIGRHPQVQRLALAGTHSVNSCLLCPPWQVPVWMANDNPETPYLKGSWTEQPSNLQLGEGKVSHRTTLIWGLHTFRRTRNVVRYEVPLRCHWSIPLIFHGLGIGRVLAFAFACFEFFVGKS